MMSDVIIRIPEIDFYVHILDEMVRLILGDEEWDAYHQFRRAVDQRMKAEGYRVYLDYDCHHRYEKIGS